MTLDLAHAHAEASHDSWATKVRLCRLDGESRGPVRTSHIVGILSDGCAKRLDITKASAAITGASAATQTAAAATQTAAVATPTAAAAASGKTSMAASTSSNTTTTLELRPLNNDESPSDEPLCYHTLVGLFSTEHRTLAAEVEEAVDVADGGGTAGNEEQETRAPEQGAPAPAEGPRWRLALAENAQAASLDEECEGTRLRLVVVDAGMGHGQADSVVYGRGGVSL